ncbi:hypothetical protein DFH09DRAFT_1034809 [Mycena vulgaris]|nr:hypothetical protein DFH09DRAFT_1034809 [Mycena vulgaris]
MALRTPQAIAISTPSVEEIAARETIRARIAAIESQVQALESSLRSLRDESKALKRRLDSYTYPVLTLPNEIVAHIFMHFLPVYPLCPPITGLFSPTALGHICHKWRETSLSTPVLWRAISLYLDDKAKVQFSLRLLESWLQRSGSCPLSIRLLGFPEHLGEELGDVALAELDPFLEAIVSHCERWEYFKTNIPLRYLGTGRTPLLRSLNIEGRLVEGSGWIAPSIEGPQLQKLALEWYREIFAIMVPWGQLTTLYLTFVTPLQFMDILHHAVNLVHCKLNIVSPEPQDVGPTKPVKLLHLQTLVLVDWSSEPPTGWIDALTLPALRRLQIAEKFLDPDHPVDTLLALISRSECSLQELYVHGSDLHNDMYRTALPSIPSVIFDRYYNIGNGLFVPESSEDRYDTDSNDPDTEDGLPGSDEASQSSHSGSSGSWSDEDEEDD